MGNGDGEGHWVMDNGSWAMGHEQWPMGKGQRTMADRQQQMGNGRRAMADGQWQRGNGNGQWQMQLATTVTGNPSIVSYKNWISQQTNLF